MLTPGRRLMTVSWTAPVNPSSPVVSYKATASTGESCVTSSLTCTINPVAANTPITVGVVACPANAADCSPPAVSAAAAKAGPPGTPPAPTVAYLGGTTAVRLTWTDPDPGAGIGSYRITPSPSAGLTGSCTTPVVGNTCDFANLTPGTSYTFKLTAIGINNSTGSTGSSLVGPASAPKYAGLPAKPAKPTVTRVSDTSVTVDWDKPSGGATIAGYTVHATPGGGAVPADCTPLPDTTECVFTGLDASQSYTFAVRANGEGADGGTSAYSDPSDPIQPGLPDKPDAPSVELGAAAGQVTVSWQAPGGGTVTGYTVTATSPSGGTLPSPAHVPGNVTSKDFSGLQDGASYTFTVTAIGAGGSQTSDPSDPIVSQLPAQPATPVATLGGGAGVVKLNWTAPVGGGPVIYYTVKVIPSPGGAALGSTSADCGFNLAAPSCTIIGLDPTASYTFTVTAVGDLGKVESAPSNSVIPNPPGKPTSVAVALTGNTGEASVTWAAPNAGGGVVASYTVTATPVVGSPVVGCTAISAAITSCLFTGLDETKSYTFVVRADNPAGSTDSLAASTSPPNIPSAPQTPTVALGMMAPGTVTVNRTAPSLGTAKKYIVKTTSSDASAALPANDCVVTAPTTSCQIPGLSPSKPYRFTVRAQNMLGSSDPSPTAEVLPDKPGAPTNVLVTVGPHEGQATVTWSPPTSGGAVDTYTVTASSPNLDATLPDESPCIVDMVSSPSAHLSCAFTGMDVDEPYQFTVQAGNNAGSNSFGPTSAVVPGAPGAPTGVDVELVASTPGSVIVTWVPPAGGAVANYTVMPAATDNGNVPTNCANLPPTATSCTFTGLRTTTSYSFVVRAHNAVGDGDADPAPQPAIVPDKPGLPTSVQVALVNNTPGSTTVTWAEPAGGGAVDHYLVTGTASDGTTANGCNVAAAAGLTCTFTNLTKTKPYVFKVSAVNVAGTSDVSLDPVMPDQPGAPTNVKVAVGANPGTATVTWDLPPGGAPDTYTVTAASGDGGAMPNPNPCTVTVTPQATRACAFTGLTPDKSYTFTVRATNASGHTDAPTTNPIIPNKPSMPGMPTAEVIAANTVRLTWTAPTQPGGPVASYTATAYAVSAPQVPVPSAHCTAVAGLTCDFDGLSEAQSYTFTVKAIGPGGGVSDEGAPSRVITTAGPHAPAAPSVQLYGSNAVRVTWTKPDSGGPVLAYTVTAHPGIATPESCLGTRALTCVFGGLTSGESYTFTVTALGTAQRTADGPASVPIVPGPPDTPIRPMVTPTADAGVVTVTWIAPGDGNGITGYGVESNPGRIGCSAPVGADGRSCTVTGLDPATSYTFRVQAYGAPGGGDSAFSPASEPIVPQAPGRPYDVNVVGGDRQVAVSWTAPDLAQRVGHYRATAAPGGAFCETAGNTQTECVITGLQNLTSYRVTVTAVGVGSIGNSPVSLPSARVRPTAGVPGAPTGVQVKVGDSGAVVTWTAPGATGDGIARYAVTATSGSDIRTCLTPDGTTLTCTVTGLTNLKKYSVSVVSIGVAASGTSVPSAPIDATPSLAPGTPTDVVVTPGAKTLDVQWKAATEGSGLAGFTATATGGAAAPLSCGTTDKTVTLCSITGVTPGTTYAVTVVANGVVPGVTSPPTAPVSADAITAPAPLLPVTATAPTSAGLLTSPSTSVKLNGTITITGTAFTPFTGVTVGIYPNGVPLATAVTDSTGKFTVTVKVTGVATGSRTIVAGGLISGVVKYKTLTVSVLAA